MCFAQRDEAVVISAHVSGRLIAIPEFIARNAGWPLRQECLHYLPRELQFLLQFALFQCFAVQLGILNRYANLIGHRDEQVQVFLVESTSSVSRIDLDDPDRLMLLVQNRHAHERPDQAIGHAFAVGEFGREVLAQDRLAVFEHSLENRLADPQIARRARFAYEWLPVPGSPAHDL